MRRLIVFNTLPRSYGLSWRPEDRAIVVLIHRVMLEALPDVPVEAAGSFEKTFSFATFSGSLRGEAFGFDQSLVRAEPVGDFIPFIAKLPVVFHLSPTIIINDC